MLVPCYIGGAMLSLLQSSPEEKNILLRVDGERDRDQWQKKLTKASLDFLTTKKKMEREKKEQCKLWSGSFCNSVMKDHLWPTVSVQ